MSGPRLVSSRPPREPASRDEPARHASTDLPTTAPLLALVCALAVAAAALVTFWPVRDHAFLNWDDATVMTAPAREPGAGGLVAWAATTRFMQHYQPLGWLALDTVAGRPPSPARVHTAAVWLHAVNAVLLFLLVASLAPRDGPADARWLAAAAATAVFAVHPMRVEPVAWASAWPYLLSYAWLLAAMLAFVSWTRQERTAVLALAVGLYLLSQLTRVTAPLLPLAVPLVAAAVPGARTRSAAALGRACLPFALVAAPLAWLEASARTVETLADIPLTSRLATALVAPAVYAWRAVAPGEIPPLDVWPRVPAVDWTIAGLVLLASGLALVVSWMASRRGALAVWGTYLLLLAPVSGLFASGLQMTADRYAYGPAMVLSVGLAAALTLAPAGLRRASFLVIGVAAVVYAQSAQAQAAFWRDSITLWTRAVELTPDNDIAHYNLALARLDAGQINAAMSDLEALLRLVPDHAPARARLGALVADRESAAGDRAAAAGQFFTAVTSYDRALAAEPTRLSVRLKRGMALAQAGQPARAVPDLEAATAGTSPEPAVANALAFGYTALSRGADAIALLRRARTAHPDDASIAANLARLLVTAEPPSLRTPLEALEIAAALNDRSGGADPRVLDTLALALDATGHRPDARAALDVALDLARTRGDAALVATLTARRAALGR